MTTQSARIHTWGCDRHKEDTYEGCASCDLEDFSELSSKLSTANARIAELEKAIQGARELMRELWRAEEIVSDELAARCKGFMGGG